MIIRRQQIEIFRERSLKQFEDRMCQHLRADFSAQTENIPESELRCLVTKGIDRAGAYGITIERDVQSYLEFMVLLEPDFDCSPRTPWVGSVLNRTDLDGTAKMTRIRDRFLLDSVRLAQG